MTRHSDGCATWHHELVAGIVASYHECVYVEIGILYAACWNIAAPMAGEAHGVDPDARSGPPMTAEGLFWNVGSDEFFQIYDGSPPDVIFVDGEHVGPQVDRDVDNALALLAPYGTIVMHDTQPMLKDAKRTDLCGTVWETLERLERDDSLQIFTFQRFPGITLIRKR